jgi:glyoxylase-like metal-dependent hydrolase (beta-lactamase superfamily II)
MYELVQISEKCYYINCPAKIGVYVADGENVYLVDSGNDKDAGRKIRQILDKNGWHLAAILNTHSNADHIGGNRYLQRQTGCKAYSGSIEAAMFVPAHADASADVKQLVRYNRDKVNGVAERILSIYWEPMCFERILQRVFKSYGLSMNFEQYVLEEARCVPTFRG